MTGMLEPDAPLLPVANAISDGEPVDWPAVESSAGEEAERALVRDLRVVAEIVALHRRLAPLPDVAAATIMDELVEESARSGSPRDPSVPMAGQSHLPAWGHLQLVELVGGGAFGEVYRARDPRLDRDVALKLLRRRESAQPRASAVVDEGRLLARVRHPNVITVYGADRIQGHVGVWMEFIQGRTLEQDLQARGPFAPEEVAGIGVDVCRALEAVHRAGLLHRDVKAQNVMREPDARIVLMDFGAGREDDAAGAASDLAGTPLYLAPEIFSGGVASAQSDLYSLGVLLYRLLTGSYPVAGRTLADVRAAHARGDRGSLREARPEVPRKLAEYIERALAHDPAERFAGAAAMEAALTTLVEPSRSPPRLWIAGVAAALMAVVAIATAAALRNRASPLSRAGGPPTFHRVEGFSKDVFMTGIASFDGCYVPFTESTAGDLAVLELATGKRRRLTNNVSWEKSGDYATYSIVSVDSTQVAYSWTHKDGPDDVRIIGIEGGAPRVLFSDPQAAGLQVTDWSRDGKYLLIGHGAG